MEVLRGFGRADFYDALVVAAAALAGRGTPTLNKTIVLLSNFGSQARRWGCFGAAVFGGAGDRGLQEPLQAAVCP